MSSANESNIIGQVARAAELPGPLQELFSCSGYAGVTNQASMSQESDTHIDGLQIIDWCLIPASLVSELTSVPEENFIGQGVLLRNYNGLTAMVTIAEAACLQLEGLVELLDCLFKVIAATPKDKYRGRLSRTFRLNWMFKGYMPCSSMLHTTWTTQEELVVGFNAEGEKSHWLAMDLMLLLEWLSAIVSPLDHRDDGAASLVLRDPMGRDRWLQRESIRVNLGEEIFCNVQVLPAPSEGGDADSQGCWRKKITGGVLLRTSSLNSNDKKRIDNRFLVLTAGALWSLFDHQLRPMPGCVCTLRAGESEFLTCEKKQDDCFFWHLNTDPETMCGGKDCSSRVPVMLTGPDQIHFKSPCLLGWPVNTRDSPHDKIAGRIMASRSFLRREAVTYTPRSFELQMQLGYSGGVTALAMTGVTFDMTRYRVSNSISHSSLLTSALSEMATTLVYCEDRKIHLAMHGADLVESICMQLLLELGSKNMPSFIQTCALERMRTWRESTFVTGSGLVVPGSEIVKHACDRMQQFMAQTKSHKEPLYWSLQEMIAGKACVGVKAPSDVDQTSWYTMWKAYPILIVAVGRISDKLLHATITQDSSRLEAIKSFFGVSGVPNVGYARRGGIFSDNALIEALLRQAYQVYPARLEEIRSETNDDGTKSFRITADETQELDNIRCDKCAACAKFPSSWPLSVCLHYFC